jgi:16S rRNA (guanine966-N2)-methyltransferase
MLDRVKESLFNIVRHDVPGARVLDLYSGSGALGLEALSRGALSCTFVEEDARLVCLIEENAERCHVADRCRVLRADVLGLPSTAPPRGMEAAGLVFVDPPYADVDDPNRRARLLRALERLGGRWVSPGAVLVLHHRPMPHAVWPVERLVQTDCRVYGRSQLTFFRLESEAADG